MEHRGKLPVISSEECLTKRFGNEAITAKPVLLFYVKFNSCFNHKISEKNSSLNKRKTYKHSMLVICDHINKMMLVRCVYVE